jgi:2-amino-4-hydroxy-6-hydroxymethyldihydropteridine diphosphokinase
MKKNNKIIFGIGSNLGDRQQNLNIAIDKLSKYLNLNNLKISTIYKNPALLPLDAPSSWNIEFFNIAMSAEINLEKYSFEKILNIVKKIESEIGRKSSARWSPREIDIDILIIDEIIYKNDDVLNIPHIGLFVRDFFYKTTQEIEPQMLENIRNKINDLN